MNPVPKNKKGFGSFFSENIEELIQKSPEDYEAPNLPISISCDIPVDILRANFGRPARALFGIDWDWTFINHGAFGAPLLSAVEVSHLWNLYSEKQPLRFLDRELLPLLVFTIRELAKFVHAPPTDIVLIRNATLGMSTIIHSLQQALNFSPRDVVVCFDLIYGSVYRMLRRTTATIREIEVLFPTSKQAIIDLLTATLDSLGSTVRLVVVDHICSTSALKLPVEELVAVCNLRNIPVLVDGAHALGALPLNLSELKPTFYVSNAHKWFCNPKGAAFMYVRSDYQKYVLPLWTSHGFGSGYTSNFTWAGLDHYGSLLSILTCLDFWRRVGPGRIRSYNSGLLHWAAAMLATRWGTDLLAPLDLFGPMISVRLPGAEQACDDDEHNSIQDRLHFQFSIEVPIKKIQKRLYVRISAHIYNTPQDYEHLAGVMLAIRPRIDKSGRNESSEQAFVQTTIRTPSSSAKTSTNCKL